LPEVSSFFYEEVNVLALHGGFYFTVDVSVADWVGVVGGVVVALLRGVRVMVGVLLGTGVLVGVSDGVGVYRAFIWFWASVRRFSGSASLPNAMAA
jgi:hypothetical protein